MGFGEEFEVSLVLVLMVWVVFAMIVFRLYKEIKYIVRGETNGDFTRIVLYLFLSALFMVVTTLMFFNYMGNHEEDTEDEVEVGVKIEGITPINERYDSEYYRNYEDQIYEKGQEGLDNTDKLSTGTATYIVE